MYKEDYNFLYSELLKHPIFIEGLTIASDSTKKEKQRTRKKTEFEALYHEGCDAVVDYQSLINAATILISFFGDGHTNIELPYTSSDLCLNLKCGWEEKTCDYLILKEAYQDIPKHSRITDVENMSVEEIITALADVIPHENIYLVKSRMVSYPYQNYHLFSEMNLNRLFGEKREYAISFDVAGEIIRKVIPLSKYDCFLDFAPEDEFLTYEVNDDTVVMHLKQCIFNDFYKKVLNELAITCSSREIKRFVLDLSENMGGDSSVIEWFLGYTHAQKYHIYEMTDYSSGEVEILTSRDLDVENIQQKLLFPEEILCKVSHDTFSSARTFAVTLKDNGIAKIIGNPTGGKPSSYGMPRKMVMPNTGIRFRVSRCRFRRPDASKDEEMTLTPDL